ncbi:MAG TPA: hypothetical protein PK151_06985 [Caldisericia bacterium]|nr:hypothetical protein [Caldisericia bacterium]
MRFDKKGKNGLPILIRCDDVWQVKQLIKLVRSGKWWVNYVENWSHFFTILRYNCFGVVDNCPIAKKILLVLKNILMSSVSNNS